jgi:hypothetical protein
MITIQYIGKARRLVFDYFMDHGDTRQVTAKQAEMLEGDGNFVIAGKPVPQIEPILIEDPIEVDPIEAGLPVEHIMRDEVNEAPWLEAEVVEEVKPAKAVKSRAKKGKK